MAAVTVHTTLMAEGKEELNSPLMRVKEESEKSVLKLNVKKKTKMKGMTEDEMVEWHHQLNGHEFTQMSEKSEGQGSLVCCSPWGHKESDMTE